MKKKIVLICLMTLIVLILSPSAYAYVVTYQKYYISSLDQYRMDFTYPTGTTSYELTFRSDEGRDYLLPFSVKPTGIMFLTCRGTKWGYGMNFFNSAGANIGHFDIITTPQIQVGLCNSYANQNGANDLNLQSTKKADGTNEIKWEKAPAGGRSDVYKDGQLVKSGPDNQYTGSKGSYTIINYDSNGNQTGRSDANVPNGYDGTNGTPGTGDAPDDSGSDGGSCNGCTMIEQMLACPSWNDYMGEWTKAIKNAMPPPTDWQKVANIMRDTIVPAMGQELVNRSPEIAKIIADEFQSREKPVHAPPAAPTFNPSPQLPQLPDLPSPVPFDLNSNIPSFEPDYSESQPFVIPDPLDIQLDDHDSGYNYPDTTDQSSPEYQHKETTQEPDKGYTITNPTVDKPAPVYNGGSTDSDDTIPNYQGSSGNGTNIPNYSSNDGDDMKYYNGGGG